MQAVLDEVEMPTGHRAASTGTAYSCHSSQPALKVPLFRASLKNRTQINLQLLLKPKNLFQPDLLGK